MSNITETTSNTTNAVCTTSSFLWIYIIINKINRPERVPINDRNVHSTVPTNKHNNHTLTHNKLSITHSLLLNHISFEEQQKKLTCLNSKIWLAVYIQISFSFCFPLLFVRSLPFIMRDSFSFVILKPISFRSRFNFLWTLNISRRSTLLPFLPSPSLFHCRPFFLYHFIILSKFAYVMQLESILQGNNKSHRLSFDSEGQRRIKCC